MLPNKRPDVALLIDLLFSLRIIDPRFEDGHPRRQNIVDKTVLSAISNGWALEDALPNASRMLQSGLRLWHKGHVTVLQRPADQEVLNASCSCPDKIVMGFSKTKDKVKQLETRTKKRSF